LPPLSECAPDHVLIKFRQAAIEEKLGKLNRRSGKAIVSELGLTADARLEETCFTKWCRNRIPSKQNEWKEADVDASEFMYLKLPTNITPRECVKRLKNNPLIEYVEVDPIGFGGATPTNDTYYAMQWHLAGNAGQVGHVHAPEAWDITTGTSDVIVAVLDTGCDPNNLDFAGRLVPGYDFVNSDPDPADDHGHGTAVSAVLCASANNGSYGVGLDWHCRLMPVKVLKPAAGGTTSGNYSWWTQGINWAVTNGAKVINLSAGGWDSDTNNTLHTAITNAIAHGLIFVTITHNDPVKGISYPGSDPVSITVGGSDTNGTRCGFSAYGTNLDLLAPATNIFTVTTGGVWDAWGGTSFAAPQVAGVAALICSIRPNLNNEQVRNLLCAGADDDAMGFNIYSGWGRLNAYNSLVLAGTAFEEIAQTNNGDIVLAWKCPPNASNKLPYIVEYTASLTGGTWSAFSNITYDAERASWTTQPTNTPTFYRIKVRGY